MLVSIDLRCLFSFLNRRLKTLVVSTLSTAIGYGIVTEFSSVIRRRETVESVINTTTKTLVDQVKSQAPSVDDFEWFIPDLGRMTGGSRAMIVKNSGRGQMLMGTARIPVMRS